MIAPARLADLIPVKPAHPDEYVGRKTKRPGACAIDADELGAEWTGTLACAIVHCRGAMQLQAFRIAPPG